MVKEIFVLLYPLVFMTTFIGYLPQIIHLIRHDDPAHNIALASWYIWLAACVISLGYGVTVLQDVMFCTVTCINLVAQAAVIMLVLYRRKKIFIPFLRSGLSAIHAKSVLAVPAE